MKKLLAFCLAMIALAGFACGGGSNVQYAYSDDNMTTPYWKMDRIYNETILMISENGEPANGKLLFQPKKILRVSDYTLKNEYKEGVDYTVDGNKLTVTENSSIPSLTQAQLYGENIPEDLTTFAGRNGHDKVLFTMGVGISMRQICVSYTYDNSQYEGPKPAYSETELPKTIAKLKAGEPIKFVVNGDSVSVGGDCSGKMGVDPFTPTWGQQIANELHRYYGSEITYVNNAKGGTTTRDWGLPMADVNLIAEEPDLAVIGYGGNDGNPTANVPREEFKQNIIQIIEYARQGNSDCEIILMGNMQGNPDAKPTYRQEELNGALAEIAEEQEGVIFVDIMSLHHYMLETKRYIDLSANNVNHASDFFARCFAMMTCARLIDYDTILK